MKRQLEEAEINDQPKAKRTRTSERPPLVDVFHAREKGKKTYLEDRILSIPDLSTENEALAGGKYALFAVFDGHGGHFAAQYLKTLFPKLFVEHLVKRPPHTIADKKERNKVVKEALIKTFLNCDKEILEQQVLGGRSDGSTCVVCFIEGKTLWTANVGDTKHIIAVKKNGTVKGISLSKDHTADKKEEQLRIQNSGTGGKIENNRVLGILEVTRSFGDPGFKDFGVICIPYISKVPISSKIEFGLLATDGLWDLWKVPEVAKYIHETMENPTKPGLKETARILLTETILDRHCTDNCSVLLYKICHDQF